VIDCDYEEYQQWHFYLYLYSKFIGMATITVKINTKSKRGKHLIALLSDMAKHGNDIQLEDVPNSETVKAIKDARAKKGFKAENIDDLFNQLEA
jgi:hypothetical protein